MKKGDVINGYRILCDFSTAGGGMSKWAFAERGGKEYFIKEFLDPIYPIDGSPGSPKIKEAKRKQCAAFEAHHKKLKDALAGKSLEGGNLIATRDFFRVGTKYYKVTEKIDVASLNIDQIAGLPIEKKVIVLRTVAHSLRILHNSRIVHGDMKPGNILIKATVTGDYTTKLIDFDNSFFSGDPPALAEEVVGDMVYYSPELGLYINGSKSVAAKDLQCKSDIFALGVIYHQYLTGRLPKFDQKKHRYVYIAVLNGEGIDIDSSIPPRIAKLIHSMLSHTPEDRPNIESVFAQLKSPDLLLPVDVTVSSKFTSSTESKLKGSLVPKSTEDAASSTVPSSKLRGTLLNPKKIA